MVRRPSVCTPPLFTLRTSTHCWQSQEGAGPAAGPLGKGAFPALEPATPTPNRAPPPNLGAPRGRGPDTRG